MKRFVRSERFKVGPWMNRHKLRRGDQVRLIMGRFEDFSNELNRIERGKYAGKPWK